MKQFEYSLKEHRDALPGHLIAVTSPESGHPLKYMDEVLPAHQKKQF